MSNERELMERAFFAKFPVFNGDLTPSDTAMKRAWLEIFEAGWSAAKSSASTAEVVLPELPEGEDMAFDRKSGKVLKRYTRVQMEAYAREAVALNREEATQDLLALRRFADAVIGEFPEHGDIDGVTLEEIAESCGLLKEEVNTIPCCETCGCAECGVKGETLCFRVQPVLTRARRAAAIFQAAAMKGQTT